MKKTRFSEVQMVIADEMSLQDLRKAMNRTQVEIARTLKVGQDTVSRYDSARTCCSPHSRITSRQWVENWISWPDFRIAIR